MAPMVEAEILMAGEHSLATAAVGNSVLRLAFGLHLPGLIGADSVLAETLKDIHETGASLGYVLIGLHAAAAPYHHDVLRDHTLRRMLPGHS